MHQCLRPGPQIRPCGYDVPACLVDPCEERGQVVARLYGLCIGYGDGCACVVARADSYLVACDAPAHVNDVAPEFFRDHWDLVAVSLLRKAGLEALG